MTRYGNTTRGAATSTGALAPREAVRGPHGAGARRHPRRGHHAGGDRARLLAQGAQRVLTAVLADKDLGRAEARSPPDFVGVRVPDRYVFGFGMDVNGAWRNLPAIYAVKGTLSAP